MRKRKNRYKYSIFSDTDKTKVTMKVLNSCKVSMEEMAMRATGIVRRIDDLGRIVIPKEIRRTLRIREADPLEIFTNQEGEIMLKKYSTLQIRN